MNNQGYSNGIFYGYRLIVLWLFVILYLVIALALSVGYELRTLDSQHQDRSRIIHRNIARRVASLETVLTSIVGLRHASDTVSYAELSLFSQDMLKAYPYITAIISLPRVVQEKRSEFEAEMHKQGFIGFRMDKIPTILAKIHSFSDTIFQSVLLNP